MKKFGFLSCALSLLLISSIAEAQSIRTQDTVYTPFGYFDGDLQGTIYFPNHPNGSAVVLVHGVGLTRNTLRAWGDSLAAHGYLAMTIDYPDPVNQGAQFPSPVSALKTAVQFFRKSASFYNINPNRIGALGVSLGAADIASAMIDEENYSVFNIANTVDDKINFAVLLYGLYDYEHHLQTNLPISIAMYARFYFKSDTVLERRETPVLQAARISAPVLLIHGDKDSTVEYQQSVEFQDSLIKYHKSSEFLTYPGRGHLFELRTSDSNFSEIGLHVKDSVIAFLSRTLPLSNTTASRPAAFTLGQNYPNPFGSSISGGRTSTIQFTTAQPGNCTITIFNCVGSLARTIMSGEFTAGHHSIEITGYNLPSGIYFYRLETREGILMRSMVIRN